MTEKMLSRKDGHVGYVIFNNPERHNAMSLEMWEATVRFLEDYAKDPEVRVLVLTGAGGKAFVSGADISKFEDERSSKEGIARYNAAVERGYAADRSTVTVVGAEGTMNMNTHTKDAGELLRAIAETMMHPPSNEYTHGGEPWFVIGP